jgi:ABC-type lipoprotein release transport system permease subunit
MAIPLSYSMRNLWKRRLTTILTVSGMALVVFVFAAVLMMAAGLQKTLVETGSDDNVVVFRKGSTSEVMSGIERGQASIVEMLPQVAIGGEGRRLVAMAFSLVMGFIGGMLPALRASRMKIVDALRAA